MSAEVIGSGFRIAGTGSALPERVVTNDEIVEMIKAGDHPKRNKANARWITAFTGIETRYFADPENEDETTAGLSIRSARQAQERAEFDPDSVDLVIVATMTTDEVLPQTSAKVQRDLGLKRAEFFDLDLACTGFVKAVTVANAMMAAYGLKRALVVGTDRADAVTDYTDMMTAPLFGAASGAIALEAVKDGRGMVSRSTINRGDMGYILNAPKGKMVMDGQAVKELGIEAMTQNGLAVLKEAGKSPGEISRIIFHQANINMITEVSDNMGIPRREDGSLNTDVVPITINFAGNSSAGTVGLTFDKSVAERPLQEGEFLVFNGVGGGVAAEAHGIQA